MEVLAGAALALALALTALWFSTRAAITLCVIEVDNGKARLLTGGLAPRVLDDVREVVKRPKVKWAKVRVLRAKDHARVEAEGDLTKEQLQQLRNVIGVVPLAKLAGIRKKA